MARPGINRRVRIALGSAVLLAALAILLALAGDVRQQLQRLGTASTDSTVWSTSQVDVEFGQLHIAALQAMQTPEADIDPVRVNFEIFYSRVETITQSERHHPDPPDPVYEAGLAELQEFLTRATPIVDAPDPDLRRALPQLTAMLTELRPSVRSLSVRGTSHAVRAAEARRIDLFATLLLLALATGGILALLVGVAAVLVRVLMNAETRAQTLAETTDRLRTIYSTSLDAMLVSNQTGEIRTANPAAAELFGQDQDALRGKQLWDLLIPETGPVEDGRAALASMAGRGRVRLTGLSERGATIPVELTLQRARLQNRDVYVVFIRDISLQISAERTLIDARDKAIAAEQAKSEFLATMSHEIRTPLNGLLGSLTLLKRTALDAQQARFVGNMETSGEVLLGHVTDVLDVTRHEAGHDDDGRTRVCLRRLLDEIVQSQEDLAKAGGNSIALRWDGPPVDTIQSRPEKLRRILSNLVGNAVKFTENGRIEITVEQLNAAPGTLRIAVSDTGPGIPADRIDKVFDDYETDTSHHPGGRRGTGLGLGIARRLAEGLGGQIGVTSEPGSGSRFWLDLPVEDQANPPLVGTAAPVDAPSEAEAVSGQTILIAEDNGISRQVLREMLELDGHFVVETTDGARAAELAGETAYDLLLFDVAMPVMDGCTAAQRIRQGGASAAAPIYAVTAHALPPEVERFKTLGFTGIMLKPVQIDALRDIVRKHAKDAPTQPATHASLDPSGLEALHARLRDEASALLALLNDPAAARAVRQEAIHRFAGSAGALGFPDLAEAAVAAEVASAGDALAAGQELRDKLRIFVGDAGAQRPAAE